MSVLAESRLGPAAGGGGGAGGGLAIHRQVDLRLITALLAAPLGWATAGDWLGVPAMVLLAAAWFLLAPREGPPVLALAFTFQWLQVTSGLFYHGLTGRTSEAIILSDYRRIVGIGLVWLACLLVGLAAALRIGRHRPTPSSWPRHTVSGLTLLAGYLGAVALIGFIHTVAWRLPGVTQGILALSFFRLVLLYLIFRRLCLPVVQWRKLTPFILLELFLGFTGYFASFREPVMILVLVLLERFDSRRLKDWLRVAAVGAGIFLLGLLWLGIRTTYRSEIQLETLGQSRTERLERVVSLSGSWLDGEVGQVWEDLDYFIHRLWAVYYPALALDQVPHMVAHEEGRLLTGAVRHILMPRLFFPNKPGLISDSELVRRYAGVWVAGSESNTSIAFGSMAESYVDFGLPWMFLPILAFGFLMGLLYRLMLRMIIHRELAIGLTTVVFWLGLYLFERSWVKTLGFTFTTMIYLGGLVFVIDRFLLARRASSLSSRLPAAAFNPPRRGLPGEAAR